jgi:hypothetical protein
MFKSRAVMLITTCTLLVFSLFMSACDKGDLKPNQAPTLEITSYGGSDTTLVGTENLASFQQKIYWNSYDVDGAVVGYAYRILDEAGNPISTPGNEYFVTGTDTDLVPVAIKNLGAEYATGWVLHYQKGAPDSIPLSSPNARRTIFTEDVYTTINFPANINGVPANKISAFEIVAIDNRGDISQVKRKYFNSSSTKPTAGASSTKGELKNAEIGQGIKLQFTIKDDDPYIGSIAWYYEYQILRVKICDNIAQFDSTGADTLGGTATPVSEKVIYRSPWMSTKNQSDISLITLTQNTNPPLKDNFKDEISGQTQATAYSKTILVVKAIDLAGIESDRTVYRFLVNGKFFPQTLAYTTKCYALGDYHYIEQYDTGSSDVLPFIKTAEGIKIARPFYLHPTGLAQVYADDQYDVKPTGFKLTAIGRPLKAGTDQTDLRIWLRWGYRGEYKDDDPSSPEKKYILRDSTGADYKSEVLYYHIQLDGQQYQFPPLQKPGMQPDPNWLRIPANHDIAQRIPLTKLTPGMHSLKIRIEDLQGKVDPTPAEINFEIVSPKPVSERSGVLVITNENAPIGTNQSTNLTKKFYTDNFTGALAADSKFARKTSWASAITEFGGNMKIFNNNTFAPSYLQQFKAVVYYHDYLPGTLHNLNNEIDAFRMFMRLNGKLILSGGQNITLSQRLMYNLNEKALVNYFNMPAPEDCFVVTELNNPPYGVKPYLIGATSMNSAYPNISLDTTTNIISLINQKKGLNTVSYFKNVNPSNALYKFACKPVNSADALAPTQADFDEFNNQVIALVKENGTLTGQPKVKSYAFGFPLSIINKTEASVLFQQIVNE